jgi:hypothetical protein
MLTEVMHRSFVSGSCIESDVKLFGDVESRVEGGGKVGTCSRVGEDDVTKAIETE